MTDETKPLRSDQLKQAIQKLGGIPYHESIEGRVKRIYEGLFVLPEYVEQVLMRGNKLYAHLKPNVSKAKYIQRLIDKAQESYLITIVEGTHSEEVLIIPPERDNIHKRQGR